MLAIYLRLVETLDGLAEALSRLLHTSRVQCWILFLHLRYKMKGIQKQNSLMQTTN